MLFSDTIKADIPSPCRERISALKTTDFEEPQQDLSYSTGEICVFWNSMKEAVAAGFMDF